MSWEGPISLVMELLPIIKMLTVMRLRVEIILLQQAGIFLGSRKMFPLRQQAGSIPLLPVALHKLPSQTIFFKPEAIPSPEIAQISAAFTEITKPLQ